jgi:hypothetical protein
MATKLFHPQIAGQINPHISLNTAIIPFLITCTKEVRKGMGDDTCVLTCYSLDFSWKYMCLSELGSSLLSYTSWKNVFE